MELLYLYIKRYDEFAEFLCSHGYYLIRIHTKYLK